MSNTKTVICKSCNQEHIIPKGKGSLLEIVEILTLHTEGIKEIPDCLEKDLRGKCLDVMVWMVEQAKWTPEGVRNLLLTYRQQAIDANRDNRGVDTTAGEDISDIQVDSAKMFNKETNWADEAQKADEYNEELERICSKSEKSSTAQLWWYDSKLEMFREELKLWDKIQDSLDKVPQLGKWGKSPQWDKHVRVLWNRLDELYRKEKKLDFAGWYLFVNQLREKMGQSPMKTPKFELRSPADKIRHFEALRAAQEQKLWDEKELVATSDLPSEDYMSLLAEIEEVEAQV